MTHPDQEDLVIARSVMLRERLASAAERLVDVTTDLLAEVRLLRTEVGPEVGRGDEDDDEPRA